MARGCGLSEMSSYGKFCISGPDAEAFLNHIGSAMLPAKPRRMGWRTGKMLAVAWVTADQLGAGDDLEIQILQKSCHATQVMDPVYDPQNEILMG